jgi:hypothetical protein
MLLHQASCMRVTHLHRSSVVACFDRLAGLAHAESADSSPEDARQKASEDLSRAVAVFPFAVRKLMERLNDQGVGAHPVRWLIWLR